MNKQEMLLTLVMEESCEIAQAANKCIRFKPNHNHYENSNLERLQIEITDLVTVLKMLSEHMKIEFDLTPSDAKRFRIEKYLEISRKMETLID